jgi:hypothetical protein
MRSVRQAVQAAKAELPLPHLLTRLGLAEHARRSARCPFHDDQSPSFSVFLGARGWRWKCHAGCGEGDEIDFLRKHRDLSPGAAVREYCTVAGQAVPAPTRRATRSTRRRRRRRDADRPGAARPPAPPEPPAPLALTPEPAIPAEPPALPAGPSAAPAATGPRLPDDAHPLTYDECYELAALRRVSPFAVDVASRFGTLFVGTVGGFRCWIITDERRLCAEARRMDGGKFPAIGSLGERKAHTLKGSVKSWPVGLVVREWVPVKVRALLAVEGGPDFLAAMHFNYDGAQDCLPIAFLGAGAGRSLHPEARALLRRRRVRFYPHVDASGEGLRAVSAWSRQIAALGGHCDAVDFRDLPPVAGRPVKDLNDCTQLAPEHQQQLQHLLP